MTILDKLLVAVFYTLTLLIDLYSFVLVAACLISWVNPDPYNPIVRILRNLTEPVLWRIRKYLPFTYIKGLDLSPLVLLLALQFVRALLM